MAAGLAGVVAMQFNLYVDAARLLIGELYARLAAGEELGEAITAARAALFAAPYTTGQARADWLVPVVYLAMPLRLRGEGRSARRRSHANGAGGGGLPQEPVGGFHGRDATLLALDRAFDSARVVLLHGMVGSGKTATASIFAHWYHRTGGSIAAQLIAPKALAAIPDTAPPRTHRPRLLVIEDVDRLADEDRMRVRTMMTRAVPGVRILLTARDPEGWRESEAVPIVLRPMPEGECLNLLATVAPESATDPSAWRPVLAHANGNPLALRTLAAAACSSGRTDRASLKALVFAAGLGAPIGVENPAARLAHAASATGLSDVEWRCFAAAIHHHGHLDVQSLTLFGTAPTDWRLPELADLSKEFWLRLLACAARAGLLAHAARDGTLLADPGYYEVHPLLPYVLAPHLERHYPPKRQTALARAFVGMAASQGNSATVEYESGKQRHVSIKWLQTEEQNLLHAWNLCRDCGWWQEVGGLLEGLFALYTHVGRVVERDLLLDEAIPYVTNSSTDEPLPERAEVWGLVTDRRIARARASGALDEAERLVRLRIHLDPANASPRRRGTRQLALGGILRDRGDPACADAFYKGAGSFPDRCRRAI
jgi:hypothetical protein